MFGGKEIGIDVQRRGRVSRSYRHVPLAVRSQDAPDRLDPGFALEAQFLAGFVRCGGEWPHQDLRVGPIEFG